MAFPLTFDLPYDGQTVLEAALQQGADLPFSCKGGVCSTCKAKLIEGKVDMDINYALEQEEVDAGLYSYLPKPPQYRKGGG